ncbi:hypothetical protein PMAYCL1PPCAC_19049 [Pristionchus mayeri]|uniref:Uncharacterized protein n=1 Tax=Pristionchus mayeri TaxID=1317129 RepID=A0AAN5I224_9BILA|nr:hypothetical protein PMAYCL1PPCAC_19049 [Pristionchus mayeri]
MVSSILEDALQLVDHLPHLLDLPCSPTHFLQLPIQLLHLRDHRVRVPDVLVCVVAGRGDGTLVALARLHYQVRHTVQRTSQLSDDLVYVGGDATRRCLEVIQNLWVRVCQLVEAHAASQSWSWSTALAASGRSSMGSH